MARRSDPGAVPAAAKPSVRAKVLSAAMEVVAELGPDRVRVQDVASRAGMSAGHVMYYFGNRDRILVDTLLLSEADLAVRRDRRVAAAPDAHEALGRLVRLYLPTGPDDVRWKLWAQLVARPPSDVETRRAFGKVVDSWAAALAAVIADGARAGVLACSDPAALAYRTCRLMDGYSLEVLISTPGRSRTWAVREVLAFVDATVCGR
ncbi:MAG: TetR family transcriptional regulator C-terminal domain-containing protein [Kineosporiaceae bacterium]